jgi:hypothetical protein
MNSEPSGGGSTPLANTFEAEPSIRGITKRIPRINNLHSFFLNIIFPPFKVVFDLLLRA